VYGAAFSKALNTGSCPAGRSIERKSGFGKETTTSTRLEETGTWTARSRLSRPMQITRSSRRTTSVSSQFLYAAARLPLTSTRARTQGAIPELASAWEASAAPSTRRSAPQPSAIEAKVAATRVGTSRRARSTSARRDLGIAR